MGEGEEYREGHLPAIKSIEKPIATASAHLTLTSMVNIRQRLVKEPFAKHIKGLWCVSIPLNNGNFLKDNINAFTFEDLGYDPP